jgi:hypothetical protein
MYGLVNELNFSVNKKLKGIEKQKEGKSKAQGENNNRIYELIMSHKKSYSCQCCR